ncbi:hypothetical protein BaRGS_00032703 [Batillaria attramentaria]|uniref:G-protein coupled receptors family 1 profile domain-containing protein n=1 Tax=Batillaria attramentaria TaxID=370345 RepID=A0ABD0JMB1_9CAEN
MTSTSPANTTQVDASSDAWKGRTQLMWSVWAPLILLCGVFGNSSVVYLLYPIRKRCKVYPFLMALAVSDTLILLFVVGPTWFAWQWQVWPGKKSIAICRFILWFGHSLTFTSTAFVVAVTVYRAVALIRPHAIHKLCRRRTVRVILGVLCMMSFGVGASVVWLTEYSDSCKRLKRQQTTVAIVTFLLYAILPVVCIIISNVLLVSALLKSVSTSVSENSLRQQHVSYKVTPMIVTVSVTYVVLTFPIAVLQILMVRNPPWSRTSAYSFGLEFCLLLWYTHSSVGFYIYICTGPEFRRQAMKRLVRRSEVSTSTRPVIVVKPTITLPIPSTTRAVLTQCSRQAVGVPMKPTNPGHRR